MVRIIPTSWLNFNVFHNENRMSKGYQHLQVCCSAAHNSQDVYTQVFVNGWMDKDVVCMRACTYVCIHMHTMEHCSAVRKEILPFCDNRDGPWGHYAKWNKSTWERQILYDNIYMWKLSKANSEELGVERWLPEAGGLGKRGNFAQRAQTHTY